MFRTQPPNLLPANNILLYVIPQNAIKTYNTIIDLIILVQPYDCNKHSTTTALKRLERVANIPVMSDQTLKQKLSEIKTYAGFNVRDYYDKSTSPFLQYMHSGLSMDKDKPCITEPTWSKFLDALRYVSLTEIATQIEDCLKTAPGPAIVHAEDKEGEYNDIIALSL